jgi:hypothetical protein
VDLGRAGPTSLRLLEELSEVYVVTTSGMLEVYETSRVLNKLQSLKLTENQLRLIINRVAGPSFVTKPAIEKALGHSACWTLPDYSSELEDAYSSGNFIDQARSLRRQCEQLVARSLGTPKDDPVTQPSFWSSSLDSLRRVFSPVSSDGRNGARSVGNREKIALDTLRASRAPLAANEQSPFPIQLSPPDY